MDPVYWLRQKKAGVCIEEFLPNPKRAFSKTILPKKPSEILTYI